MIYHNHHSYLRSLFDKYQICVIFAVIILTIQKGEIKCNAGTREISKLNGNERVSRINIYF